MNVPADANAPHWSDPADEARIEAALAGTCPASDAPPWTLGVASKESDMNVRCRTVDSVVDQVQGLQRHIAARAQELFRARGGALGAFVVEAAVAGVDSKQFEVQVAPTELVLSAHVHHSDREQDGEVALCEFANGPLFRSYTFPAPIDPARVSAEYRNGLLRVTAPLAQPATKVEIQAA